MMRLFPGGENTSSSRKYSTFVIALAGLSIAAPYIPAVEPSSDLHLDSYEIIGKDTRAFSIVGDRQSTVDFSPERLELPMETRSVHTSLGLLPDDVVLRRGEALGKRDGIFAFLEGVIGSRTLADIDLGASYDADDRAATVKIHSRSRSENTPTNLAPSVRGFDTRGYFDTPYGNYSFDVNILGESENSPSGHFRDRNRDMERYSGNLRTWTEPFKGWELQAGASIHGGKYRDYEFPFDRGEFGLEGSASLTGTFDEVTVIASADIDQSKFGSESGSKVSFGANGLWLPMDGLGVKGGLRFYASAMPGYSANLRVYPEAALDWVFSPDMYVRLEIHPRVIGRSFFDLYQRNGLITPDVPLLYEDRRFDISAEYGIEIESGVHFTAGFFGWRGDHAPAFSRKGDLFEIVPNSRLTVSGLRFGARFNRYSRWELSSLLAVQNAAWNHPGKAPYMPSFELKASGKYIPKNPWTIYSTLQLAGKHYTEMGTDASAKAFMTVDAGVEREVVRRYADMYAEIKNLLNSSGAWWTEDYRIPGIGLYIGIRARY